MRVGGEAKLVDEGYESGREMSDRSVWTTTEILALFDKPLLDLLFNAQCIHRTWHRPNEIQLSTLLSIKASGSKCGSPADAGLFEKLCLEVAAQRQSPRRIAPC